MPWKSLLFLTGLCLLLRLPSFWLPMDRDEGEYATLAQQWRQGGGVPYRDFLEQKPPLAIFANLAAFELGGQKVLALRWMAAAWQTATVLALFFLLRSWPGLGQAWLACLLFLLASSGAATQGLAANTEGWLCLPFVACVGALSKGLRRPQAWWPWFLAGLGLGVASLGKQVVLTALFWFPCLLAISFKDLFKKGLLFIFGACLVWVGCFLFLQQWQAGRAFLYCTWTYNFLYAGQGMGGFFWRLLGTLIHLAGEQAGLWLAALGGLWFCARNRTRRGDAKLLLAWALSAASAACASGRLFPHYFLILAAPVACLAAVWLMDAEAGFKAAEFAPFGRLVRLVCMLVFVGQWWLVNGFYWENRDREAISRHLYGVESMVQAEHAAAALAQADPGGKKLWIWGSEAEIYFLSQRRPACRFLFHYPFNGVAPAWPGGEEEMLAALRDPQVSSAVIAAPLGNDAFETALKRELNQHYHLVAEGPGIQIAVRNGKGAS